MTIAMTFSLIVLGWNHYNEIIIVNSQLLGNYVNNFKPWDIATQPCSL
jgi:hypothetical protein